MGRSRLLAVLMTLLVGVPAAGAPSSRPVSGVPDANVDDGEWKIRFWRRQRKGTNLFNRQPTMARFRAARRLGVDFVRLTPSKWRRGRRDFLLGNASRFRGVVKSDLRRLLRVLGMAQRAGLKVVLTTLSLPGARWRQHNGFRWDLRLWRSPRYQDQAIRFWKEVATALRGLRAIVGYNLLNEPIPEKTAKRPFSAYAGRRIRGWYSKVKGGPADLNRFYRRAVAAIREVDRKTPIVLDSGLWASPRTFVYLRPLKDRRVLYSAHMYEPYRFTNWRQNKGRHRYPGSIPMGGRGSKRVLWNRATLERYLKPLTDWAGPHRVTSRRILIGEFGVNRRVPGARRYLADLVRIFNARGRHWSYYS